MTEKEFQHLIAAYGSNAARWPAEAQSQALAFAATEEGRKCLAHETTLDDILSLAPAPKPADAAFMDKLTALSEGYETLKILRPSLLSRLQDYMPEIASWLRPKMLAAEGATLSIALVIGIWVGGQQATAQDEELETDLSYSLFSDDMSLEENMESLNEE